MINDAKGILSLYEAAHLRYHGEEILEKALTFTKAHLKSLAQKSCPSMSKQINKALETPLLKGMPRLEVHNYISFYQEDESRNHNLLLFAKLEFNRVQLLHQKELSYLSRYITIKFSLMLPSNTIY